MNLKERTVQNLIELGKPEIEAYRFVLDLTLQELADLCKVKKQAIFKYEKGERKTPQYVIDLLKEKIK